MPYASSSAPSSSGFFAHHGLWAPGVRLFRQLRFPSKALLISACFALPLLGLLVWQLLSGAADAREAREDALRQHVEVAHGVLQWAYGLEKAGTPREQAQDAARKAIALMRYDGNEYFWLNDMEPRVVMHPIKPELDGKEVGDLKDPNGKYLFRAFVDVAKRQGKGFVEYQWPRPGSEAPVDKLSYVMAFEPWGWVLGTGTYVDDLRTALRQRVTRVVVVALVALLLAGYLFFSFYKVMGGGLSEVRRYLNAIAQGDLTHRPRAWGNDEAAWLLNDLSTMQDSLATVVARVRASSDRIVSSSDEVAQGAQDLSTRTEAAASNLAQSASSMQQISTTVANGSGLIATAADVARRNAGTATEGGAVMSEVASTMEEIRSASARIADIIGTIDGIAFQTNILALNAAVEAARAGEQGRGFAVVAAEVRSLAQRSAGAAKEIKTLIQSNVESVESGTQTVRRAAGTIQNIVEESRKVDGLLAEVANGSREQSQGIQQIGAAVQQLQQNTEQNAGLVEQTAAAAASMKQLADALADEVSRFRLPQA
ncbi:methyl-accepting chemotaxis protein [Roseateles paludis]|uniref:Methyl-accepting chemotaxis protein n=1 Tax=Roseateles paludis TaxID=3145238 RepID=A0ABV0G2I7_9BURK